MREITGRHVAIGMVSAFGLIVAVNLVLAWQAVATFPGLEVKNSYVASQTFDADRRAQEALGWTADTRLQDGVLTVALTGRGGRPAAVADIAGRFGRATSAAEDQTPAFERVGPATFAAPVEAGRGIWILHLTATAEDGTAFRQRVRIGVP